MDTDLSQVRQEPHNSTPPGPQQRAARAAQALEGSPASEKMYRFFPVPQSPLYPKVPYRAGNSAEKMLVFLIDFVFSRKDLETERDQITFYGKFKYFPISQMRAVKNMKAVMGNKGGIVFATLGLRVQSSVLDSNDLP